MARYTGLACKNESQVWEVCVKERKEVLELVMQRGGEEDWALSTAETGRRLDVCSDITQHTSLITGN